MDNEYRKNLRIDTRDVQDQFTSREEGVYQLPRFNFPIFVCSSVYSGDSWESDTFVATGWFNGDVETDIGETRDSAIQNVLLRIYNGIDGYATEYCHHIKALVEKRLQTIEKNPGPEKCKFGDKCRDPSKCKFEHKKVKVTKKSPTKKTVQKVVKASVPKQPSPTFNMNYDPRGKAQAYAAKANINERIALTIAAPGMHNERFPTGLNCKSTALASPFEIVPCSFGQALTVPTGGGVSYARPLPLNEGFACIFRDPLRTAVIYDSNAQGYQCGYGTTAAIVMPFITTTWTCKLPYLSFLTGQPFHGNFLYAAKVASNTNTPGSYFYCDAGQVINVSISNGTGNVAAVSMNLDAYIPSQGYVANYFSQAAISVANAGTSVLQYGVNVPGYYCISLFCNTGFGANSSNTFVVNSIIINDGGNATNNCAHFRHLCIKNLDKNCASMEQIRMTGISLMFSNFNTALNLGGMCCGLQSGGEDNWFNWVGSVSTLNQVQSSKDSVLLNASNGMYGFMKPQDYDDMNFLDDYETTVNGVITDAGYTLDNTSGFLMIAVSNPVGITCAGEWTIRTNLEYSTTDVFRDTAVSELSDEDTRKALFKIRFMPQFSDNTGHLDKIINFLGKGAKWVSENAVPIATTVAKIATLLV